MNVRAFRLLCLNFFMLINFLHLHSQVGSDGKVSVPACNNEDFETGPGGAVTSSTGVSGWDVYKLVLPVNPFISNCAMFTHTAVTRTNPTAATLFTANGHIDTLLGANYPVYSVFGSGSSNGGEVFNPGIGTMYGTSYFRIGDASGIGYNHHSIEKTINVTPSNALFRFAYISVVKMGTSCCDAPSVQVKFFHTSSGNTVMACPVYSVNAPIANCPNNTTPPMIATSNTSIPAIGVYYHKWKIEAVDLSPYIGTTVTFKMLVTYCSGGCAKYAYSYLDAQCSPMEVYVNGTPFPAHTNSVTFSGCGLSSATVVAPPDFSSYQWTGPAGFTSTLSTVTTSASGVYTLNIFTSGTCSVITKYVNINLYPVPIVSLTTSHPQLCPGQKAKLTAGGLNTYTWSSPGNSSTLAVSPTVTTTYTVSGHNTNGCPASGTITQSVISCAGLRSAVSEAGLLIFPNPNNGEFTIRTEKDYSTCMMYIKNGLGQLVHSQAIRRGENNIKTNGLAAGIYYCTVVADDRVIHNEKLELK